MKNVFVIGLDPFRLRQARTIRHADEIRFHGLLDHDEVIMPVDYPFEEMLDKARRQLQDFPGRVDAIIVHWDWPASTMLPILCEEFGLRSASLEAVLKCEHKYWSRLEQREAVPELTPRFAPVDPFDDDALRKLDMPFPFWMKPVKAFSSHLGFRIDDGDGFREAARITRENIRRLGDPFNLVLARADLPPEIQEVDGNHCVAEEIVGGKQCGIEGWVRNGRVGVHGVFDCVRDARRWSFTRYEYPSVWPKRVQDRMVEATQRLMTHIGFDDSPFGVEFFWDDETDALKVLEVNTRISQSHSEPFIKVEGVSNHEVAVDVALGREPEIGRNAGPYACSAKFMLRKYSDAKVLRIPTEDELREIEEAVADGPIVIVVEEGQQLSDLRDQDSYSYEIAQVYLGAASQRDLVEKYREVAHRLRFEFSDGEEVEDVQFEWVRY